MNHHTRCRSCGHRRKLKRHPDEYLIQPRCECGARSWRLDNYRHRVELEQIRRGLGRYARCYCSGHALVLGYPHRLGSVWCCYQSNGEPKTLERFEAERKRFEDECLG